MTRPTRSNVDNFGAEDDFVPDVVVSEPTPTGQPAVNISQSALDALLAKAVQAGAAQAAAHFSSFVPSLGAPAVDAEAPEVWSKADLWRKVLSRIVWHNEREVRAAALALDNHYPLEEGDDEGVTTEVDIWDTQETATERAAREARESRTARQPAARTAPRTTARATRDV